MDRGKKIRQIDTLSLFRQQLAFCQPASFLRDSLPDRSNSEHSRWQGLHTSILTFLFVFSPFVLPVDVGVPEVAFPLLSPCAIGRVSSSLRAARGISMRLDWRGRTVTHRLLLFQPHPLLILQEQGMPALFHIQVATSHFYSGLVG